MKYLKVLAVAIITMFAVEGAHAQVVVRARVGAPAHRVYTRRTVVTTRPVYRRPYRRTVVVSRPLRTRRYYHRRNVRVGVIRRHY